MTVQNMIDELEDHGFADTATARKVAVINDTLWDIESRHPWPFLETENTAFTLTAGSATPSLPSDFSKMLSFTIPSEEVVMLPERLDTITKMIAGHESDQGVPGIYYFVGNTLKIWKVPQTTYTASIRYLKSQPEVDENDVASAVLLPARHHRVVVLGALYKLYAMEDDPELAIAFKQQYEERIELMAEDLFKRQYDRTDRIVDVWGDWYDYDEWYL